MFNSSFVFFLAKIRVGLVNNCLCTNIIGLYNSILLYSGASTYVGLYGSGVFNFGSYVSLPTLTLFTCFLGFDVPTSSSIFIENVFYYSFFIIVNLKQVYIEKKVSL